jgi:multidrug efflux pump subunit AcrA (membrane-fusion protein)
MGILESIKAAAYGALGAAASFLLMLGIYEGVPLVRNIPYIGSIPVIGELATGRVATEAAKAATAARAGYVQLSEKTALQAQLDRERQETLRAAQLQHQARQRAAVAAAAKKVRDEKLEETIRSDTAPGSTWTADDDKWLRDHRAKTD